jgi:DNA polymerase-3 subunit beta
MQLTIHRAELLAALARAATVVNKKSTLPVLACVCLTAGDEGITIEGGDTEQRLILTAKATVLRPGKALADVAKLLGIVRGLSDDTVEIAVSAKNEIKITAGRVAMSMRAFPEAYIDRPKLAGSSFKIAAVDFARLIGLTEASVCENDHQRDLLGIYVESAKDGVRFVSTSGHWLSWAEAPITGDLPGGEFKRSLIPRGILPVLSRFASDAEGDMLITVGNGAMNVATDASDQLWFRLVDGQFPDYRPILPLASRFPVSVPVDALTAALKRAVWIVQGRAKAVRFNLAAGELRLQVSNGDEDMDETIPCDYNGEPLCIGINPRFLLDIASHGLKPHLSLHCGHALAPILVGFAGVTDCEFVVMPMRLD